MLPFVDWVVDWLRACIGWPMPHRSRSFGEVCGVLLSLFGRPDHRLLVKLTQGWSFLAGRDVSHVPIRTDCCVRWDVQNRSPLNRCSSLLVFCFALCCRLLLVGLACVCARAIPTADPYGRLQARVPQHAGEGKLGPGCGRGPLQREAGRPHRGQLLVLRALCFAVRCCRGGACRACPLVGSLELLFLAFGLCLESRAFFVFSAGGKMCFRSVVLLGCLSRFARRGDRYFESDHGRRLRR